MGLYIYQVKPTSEGNTKFLNPERVSLAGKNGPIRSFVYSKIDKETIEPFTWHMSKGDMLLKLGVSENDLSSRAIVIDLKPKEEKAELYLLQNVWGYTANDWTPIALHLEELSIGVKRVRNAAPSIFTSIGSDDTPIVEFLYLQGGLKKDNWRWGPVGSVNGALLWPSTLQYFLSVFPKQAIGGS
ncbi:MAG: hypothetical protein WAV76_06665 [Bacteroidota bacterium]